MDREKEQPILATGTGEPGRGAGRVYDLIDPPLWLVTSAAGESRGGFIATFVVRASIVSGMPRMVLGVAKQHHTWGLIQASGRFALHLIHPHRLDLVWRFGLASGRDGDKLAGLETRATPGGNPLIADSPGWLDCRVETSMDIGDRTVYLGAVDTADATDGAEPLTVRRLFAEAPRDRRRQLETLYIRDGEIDAAAIESWRAARRAGVD
jgi:flavin reductase (DIM6/NTAB) family NADH-FMN oxidoreductase RutF